MESDLVREGLQPYEPWRTSRPQRSDIRIRAVGLLSVGKHDWRALVAMPAESGWKDNPTGPQHSADDPDGHYSGLPRLMSGKRLRFSVIALVAVLWVVAQCAHSSQQESNQSSTTDVGLTAGVGAADV